jgi:hypothetical protein
MLYSPGGATVGHAAGMVRGGGKVDKNDVFIAIQAVSFVSYRIVRIVSYRFLNNRIDISYRSQNIVMHRYIDVSFHP